MAQQTTYAFLKSMGMLIMLVLLVEYVLHFNNINDVMYSSTYNSPQAAQRLAPILSGIVKYKPLGSSIVNYTTNKLLNNEKYESKPDAYKTNNQGCFNRSKFLTLFTTFHDKKSRRLIYNNTLLNWSRLPGVTVVFFLDPIQDYYWLRRAQRFGLYTEAIPKLREEIPVLKDMYAVVGEKYPAKFVSYVNADILFDYTLIETLSQLSIVFPRVKQNTSLIVGKRRNIAVHHILNETYPEYVAMLVGNASLYRSDAQDYFLVSCNAYFPWNRIPDFVIGKDGYDNWLVIQAQAWNLTLIDATNSITAIHQNDPNQPKYRDRSFNLKLVPPKYPWGAGMTECARWMTKWSKTAISCATRERTNHNCSQLMIVDRGKQCKKVNLTESGVRQQKLSK